MTIFDSGQSVLLPVTTILIYLCGSREKDETEIEITRFP